MKDLLKTITIIILLCFIFPNLLLAIIGFIALFLGFIQLIFDTSETGAMIIAGIIIFILFLRYLLKKQ